MTTGTSRTGPKPRFAEQDAVNIALELGLTDFTLGAVADRLGVRTSALYRIIASRDHLVELCVKHVATNWPFKQTATTWQTNLTIGVNALWEIMDTYEGLDQTMLTSATSSIAFQKHHREFKDRLNRTGFPGDDATADLLIEFVFGSVIASHCQVAAVRAAHKLHNGADPDQHWLARGYVDEKVAFFINAIEQGLSVLPFDGGNVESENDV
ncbi:TetR/AcrR family transcriptional regulator [Corynebacterium hindlerae]|uniref:TetR/AcrR family transcriptional regulator n=2 Tax=Corynebacterium hindlerae TaxID=699041 RepID=UPI0031B679B8